MRVLHLIGVVFFSVSAAFCDEIREFDISTLEKLGNELSQRDAIAARAADLVLDQYPEWGRVVPQWWISDLGSDSDAVYLIDARKSEAVLGYKVVFHKGGLPIVEDLRGDSLPPQVAQRYKAQQTGYKAVSGKLYTSVTNFEVLGDPNGSGFLVYALAVTTKKGEILTGGHYRITVSADGARAEQIDLLSQLILQPKPERGNETVAIASAQFSSNNPVETWLYSSHLYRLPMFVATIDGSVWRVWDGKMHKFTKAEVDAVEAKEKKKKRPRN